MIANDAEMDKRRLRDMDRAKQCYDPVEPEPCPLCNGFAVGLLDPECRDLCNKHENQARAIYKRQPEIYAVIGGVTCGVWPTGTYGTGDYERNCEIVKAALEARYEDS